MKNHRTLLVIHLSVIFSPVFESPAFLKLRARVVAERGRRRRHQFGDVPSDAMTNPARVGGFATGIARMPITWWRSRQRLPPSQ